VGFDVDLGGADRSTGRFEGFDETHLGLWDRRGGIGRG
jgi:hypothetical protein